MFDFQEIKSAAEEMVNNKDWNEVLKYAPGGAYLRIGLAFYASKLLSQDEKSMSDEEKQKFSDAKDQYREFREALESQLNAEELKYLSEAFDRMGVDVARDHYNDLFSKKTPEEQAQGQQQYEALMNEIKSGTARENGSEGTSEEHPVQEDQKE